LIGMVRKDPVDMVVLAVGLSRKKMHRNQELFNISVQPKLLPRRHPKLAPVSTFTDGYLCGRLPGSKDIPIVLHRQVLLLQMFIAQRRVLEMEPIQQLVEALLGCKHAYRFVLFSYLIQRIKKAYITKPCKGCGTAWQHALGIYHPEPV